MDHTHLIETIASCKKGRLSARDRAKITSQLAGVPVNRLVIGSLNFTLLHLAVLTENTDLVEIMLFHGSSVNSTCRFGRTPEDYAVAFQNRDIMKLFESYRTEVTVSGMKRQRDDLERSLTSERSSKKALVEERTKLQQEANTYKERYETLKSKFKK